MSKSTSYEIFKKGSTTFFTASLFFPKQEKKAVFELYAFVRIFDDFVDCVPPQESEYFSLKNTYIQALSGQNGNSSSEVVTNFIVLQKKYGFDQSWVDAFFESMEADLTKKTYATLLETEKYIYGSAEVIGLMMAKIMKLSPESYPFAQLLGKSFQYMNMIRDVADDLALGRTYLPQSEYEKFGLREISKAEAFAKSESFNEFIRSQIELYSVWRDQARQGFDYIPSKYLVPIKIALDLFDDTIETIRQNPLIVFEKKIKPSKAKIAITTIKQIIFT